MGKKSHLGCLISFELPMGFQNFVVINKIHHLKKMTINKKKASLIDKVKN